MPNTSHLPAYTKMLAAYHRGFEPELRAVIASLTIQDDAQILDMACGDGYYTSLLADRLREGGRVVAVDANPAFLETARDRVNLAQPIEFVRAPIDSLPFDAGTFDLCWCAQSLYSLPEPVAALKHLFRVTKPGGLIAVLESDSLHHVILPWSIELELAVRSAELRALASESEKPAKFYIGRSLRRVFRQAGLMEVSIKTVVYDRKAPLAPDEMLYFTEYLRSLREKVAEYLDASTRREFDRMTSPDSSEFLLNDPDLTATCIDQLAWARKPASR